MSGHFLEIDPEKSVCSKEGGRMKMQRKQEMQQQHRQQDWRQG